MKYDDLISNKFVELVAFTMVFTTMFIANTRGKKLHVMHLIHNDVT